MMFSKDDFLIWIRSLSKPFKYIVAVLVAIFSAVLILASCASCSVTKSVVRNDAEGVTTSVTTNGGNTSVTTSFTYPKSDKN